MALSCLLPAREQTQHDGEVHHTGVLPSHCCKGAPGISSILGTELLALQSLPQAGPYILYPDCSAAVTLCRNLKGLGFHTGPSKCSGWIRFVRLLAYYKSVHSSSSLSSLLWEKKVHTAPWGSRHGSGFVKGLFFAVSGPPEVSGFLSASLSRGFFCPLLGPWHEQYSALNSFKSIKRLRMTPGNIFLVYRRMSQLHAVQRATKVKQCDWDHAAAEGKGSSPFAPHWKTFPDRGIDATALFQSLTWLKERQKPCAHKNEESKHGVRMRQEEFTCRMVQKLLELILIGSWSLLWGLETWISMRWSMVITSRTVLAEKTSSSTCHQSLPELEKALIMKI